MCGRFVAATDPDGLVRFFVVDDRRAEPLEPSYNVAPTQSVYAVAEHGGRRHLVTFRWGLIPHWAGELRVGSRMINARAETVHAKAAFRDSFRSRRCLIPADGFYEWQSRAGARVPYFIHRPDGAPMAFAGLWSTWRDPTDKQAPPVRSCAIVTNRAIGPVADLHDRMPVILPRRAWDLWLDRTVPDSPALRGLLEPVEPPSLCLRPVSAEVNSTQNDHPGLLEPVTVVSQT